MRIAWTWHATLLWMRKPILVSKRNHFVSKHICRVKMSPSVRLCVSLQSASGRFLRGFGHWYLHNEDTGEHQGRWVFTFRPRLESDQGPCNVHIASDVLFPGSHDVGPQGKQRTFLGYTHCRESIGLAKGKTYLIMGTSRDIYKDEQEQTWVCYMWWTFALWSDFLWCCLCQSRAQKDLSPLILRLSRYQYVLGERTWIEYWPTTEECQTEKYRPTCLGMDEMREQYKIFGCLNKWI